MTDEPTTQQVDSLQNNFDDDAYRHIETVEKWAGRIYVEGNGSLAGVRDVAEQLGLEVAKVENNVACLRNA